MKCDVQIPSKLFWTLSEFTCWPTPPSHPLLPSPSFPPSLAAAVLLISQGPWHGPPPAQGLQAAAFPLLPPPAWGLEAAVIPNLSLPSPILPWGSKQLSSLPSLLLPAGWTVLSSLNSSLPNIQQEQEQEQE